jgi:hypothetical protein
MAWSEAESLSTAASNGPVLPSDKGKVWGIIRMITDIKTEVLTE